MKKKFFAIIAVVTVVLSGCGNASVNVDVNALQDSDPPKALEYATEAYDAARTLALDSDLMSDGDVDDLIWIVKAIGRVADKNKAFTVEMVVGDENGENFRTFTLPEQSLSLDNQSSRMLLKAELLAQLYTGGWLERCANALSSDRVMIMSASVSWENKDGERFWIFDTNADGRWDHSATSETDISTIYVEDFVDGEAMFYVDENIKMTTMDDSTGFRNTENYWRGEKLYPQK